MASPEKNNERFDTHGRPVYENRTSVRRPPVIRPSIPDVSKDYINAQKGRLTGEQILNRDAADARRRRNTERAVGNAAIATGAAVQGTGKVISGASRAISRVPVVGTAVGAVGMGIGKTAETAGRYTRKAGRNIKRSNPIQTTSSKKGSSGEKIKVTRATWIAAGLCFGLYYYQVGFWVVSMAGAGIEVGGDMLASIFSAEDLKAFMILILGKVISLVLPGQGIFVVGYIVSMAIAWIQIFITAGVYVGNGINPFRGLAFITLIFVFAFSTMPFLGIFPWVFVWMYFVYREYSK